MASQAKILWQDPDSLLYVQGPLDKLEVGTEIHIKNDDLGGEVSYQFRLVKKPIDSTAALISSGLPTNERKFTPDKPGTYVVRLVVNRSKIDTGSGAVLYYPSRLREPAHLETTEWGGKGWDGSRKYLHEVLNYGVGTKPAAAEQFRGRIWIIPGATGVADTFEVCVKLATDTYAWVNLIAAGTIPGLTHRTNIYKNATGGLTYAEVAGNTIIVDSSSAAVTLTFPPLAVPPDDGVLTYVKRLGANPVTLLPAAGNSIEGGASLILGTDRAAVHLNYVHGPTANIKSWEVMGASGFALAGSSKWTDTGTTLHPAGGESVVIGGVAVVASEMLRLIGELRLEGNLHLPNPTWNGYHIILGSYRIWVDTNGVPRIKSGAPASDTDGIPIGMLN